MVKADTKVETVDQAALVQGQAEVAAVQVIVDIAVLIAFGATRYLAGVAVMKDVEEEQIADIVGLEMVKLDGFALSCLGKAGCEICVASHLAVVAIVQLYFGGGKVGQYRTACRKTGYKSQSATQISDMFFLLTLTRK